MTRMDDDRLAFLLDNLRQRGAGFANYTVTVSELRQVLEEVKAMRTDAPAFESVAPITRVVAYNGQTYQVWSYDNGKVSSIDVLYKAKGSDRPTSSSKRRRLWDNAMSQPPGKTVRAVMALIAATPDVLRTDAPDGDSL